MGEKSMMQWLILSALVLFSLLVIKWIIDGGSKRLETKSTHKSSVDKLRLEPSARLPEITTPVANYQHKQFILSKAEQAFHKALTQGLGDQFMILMKVRVSDILQPDQGLRKSAWQNAYNRITTKKFDFLLCSLTSYEIIAAIELDDSNNDRINRKKRDKFLNAACESANFPLIRISERNIYSAQEIKAAILGGLRDYKLHQAA